ncbi:MAG: hypothetical protein AAFU64_08620 [Bacteroidota bacterium]
MKYEEIEPYIIDYIQGDLDESRSYLIQAYLKENPDFQKELDELKDTLVFVQEAPLQEPEPELKMKFYGMLSETQVPITSSSPTWQTQWLTFFQKQFFLRSASVLAFILVIFLAGYYTASLSPESNKGAPASSLSLDQTQEESAPSEPQAEEEELAQQDTMALSNEPSDELAVSDPQLEDFAAGPPPGASAPKISSQNQDTFVQQDQLSLKSETQNKEIEKELLDEEVPTIPQEQTRKADLYANDSQARGRSQVLLEESQDKINQPVASLGYTLSPDPQSDERIQLVYARLDSQDSGERIIYGGNPYIGIGICI